MELILIIAYILSGIILFAFYEAVWPDWKNEEQANSTMMIIIILSPLIWLIGLILLLVDTFKDIIKGMLED